MVFAMSKALKAFVLENIWSSNGLSRCVAGRVPATGGTPDMPGGIFAHYDHSFASSLDPIRPTDFPDFTYHFSSLPFSTLAGEVA